MNPSDSPPADEALAAQVARGNEKALALLMQRYESKLMRYGARLLGTREPNALEQAVQDTFIAVYQNIEGFDVTQRFSPWIYRIAHNQFINILRHTSRYLSFGFEFDQFVPHAVDEGVFAKEKEDEEIRVLVEKGLSALSPEHREILVLYYFESLSYKEIADVLRIPIGTVGVRLARARNALRKGLPDPSLLPL